MMKTRFLLLVVLLSMAVLGCTRTVVTPTPQLDPNASPAPTDTFAPPPSPTAGQDTPAANASQPAQPANTETASDDGSPTPFIITPTNSEADTATPEPTNTAGPSPTVGPTNTPTDAPTPSTPPLNPVTQFEGSRRFTEDFSTTESWVGNNGKLPDNDFLFLQINDGTMNVTGQVEGGFTWWYTPNSSEDFYIEMTAHTGDCTGDDAYGLIVRGAEHDEPARGYIVGFTCGGEFFVSLLSKITDANNNVFYPASPLIAETFSSLINDGKDETNKLGILFEGDTMIVYANGYQVAVMVNDAHESGRYGIYVRSDDSHNYTYTISLIELWEFVE